MSQIHVDFAIVGSTPLAQLVAGLLASTHGKSVLIAPPPDARSSLLTGVDLSVDALTRPQSWALLRKTNPEALKLINRLGGRDSWSRVQPVLFAETRAGQAALAHIAQLAFSYGHAGDLVPERSIGDGRHGARLRHAIRLHRPVLGERLDQWLDGLERITRLPRDSVMTVHPDGRGSFAQYSVRQVVLADDDAILRLLPQSIWPDLLQRRTTSSILTEPTRQLVSSVMQHLDSGLMLIQRKDRCVLAIGPGDIGAVGGSVSTFLGGPAQYRQAGQTSFSSLATVDGAPAVGRINGTGPDVLAGLGATAPFLAPAIARWLSAKASADENAWFGARLVNRQTAPSPVAEFAA